MSSMVTLGEIITKMVQTQGEKVLAEPQRMLAVFMDMAPQMKKEKELLRQFSLCNGPSKILSVKNRAHQDQERCINSLVRELEDSYGMSQDSAKYICKEFYRGVTGKEWIFSASVTGAMKAKATDSGRFSQTQNTATYGSTSRAKRPWWLAAVAAMLLLCVLIIPKLGNKQSGQTIEKPSASNQTAQNQSSTGQTAQNQSSTGQTAQHNVTTHVHQWKDATCTSPQKCSTCGETSGRKLNHEWLPATFTTAKTCAVCKCTEGEAINYKTISVESEVSLIRDIYNSIEPNVKSGSYRKENLRNGVNAYYDSKGELTCAVVYRGTEGLGNYSQTYSRSYYFESGKLIFAFFEGTADSHRLYFYDELLMRWRYTASGGKAHNYDFAFSEEYYLWEQLARSEVETFY